MVSNPARYHQAMETPELVFTTEAAFSSSAIGASWSYHVFLQDKTPTKVKLRCGGKISDLSLDPFGGNLECTQSLHSRISE